MNFNYKESLGYLTTKISKQLRLNAQEQLDKANMNLKMYYMPILLTLSRKDGLPQNEIAKLLSHDRHRISKILDELEKSDWIRRQVSEKSKRVKLVFLTENAKTKMLNVMNCRQKVFATAFKDLSIEEAEQAISLLKKILDNLQTDDSTSLIDLLKS